MKPFLNEVLSITAQAIKVAWTKELAWAFLNEVLSITAQDIFHLQQQSRVIAFLNEVLSITAQVGIQQRPVDVEEPSSMKS